MKNHVHALWHLLFLSLIFLPGGLTAQTITLIPNPSLSQSIDVEVKGSTGQPVEFQVVDELGKSISQIRIEKVMDGERIPIRLGSSTGKYILKVTTPTQSKTLKLLKN